ncbi:hypothetical protein A2U01_0084680, partial [Trifolium medium]|nr:hypothetical protein [Trifolium medium]
MWRTVWGQPYSSKKIEDERFRIFEKAIVDRPTTRYELDYNYPSFADRTEEELDEIFRPFNNSLRRPFNA